MLHLIIGHRGTGKTHLEKIISKLYKDKPFHFVDLDKYIELQEGKKIEKFFLENKESSFREIEKKAFLSLTKKYENADKDIFISLGAGFQLKQNPNWNIIYLKRITDSQGRVFFNRPRLCSTRPPWNEYMECYKKRNSFYNNICDESFVRLEHFLEPQFFDYLFFGFKKNSQPCFSLTLKPESLPKEDQKLKYFIDKRLNWGVRFFEFNDKYIDTKWILRLRNYIPKNKILFSSQKNDSYIHIQDKINWSWDLSLGDIPKGVNILSLHKRTKSSLEKELIEFSKYQKDYHLKLSIPIFNLEELYTAYLWQKEDPTCRSFLPSSSDGRWRWFRALFGKNMFLSFVKEEDSDILDQPFFSEVIHFKDHNLKFAAVVGDPIDFSISPFYHYEFFKKRNISFCSIPLHEEDMTKKNLDFLNKMGCVFLAVTSPLKIKAYQITNEREEDLNKIKSANTMISNNRTWNSYNTDIIGVDSILDSLKSKSVVVWGGRGVRQILKQKIPFASFYSASQKTLISGEEVVDNCDILIWAVNRRRIEDKSCFFPPESWKFKRIVDLNYSEDSPGRDYALKTGSKYESGLSFFKKQAKEQQNIFESLEK